MIVGITGSTGCLGRRLTEYLISKGFKLRLLVRKTSKVEHFKSLGVELVYGDINNPESVVDFIKGLDICYHIAAQVAAASKKQLFESNIGGTRNICEALLKNNPGCRLIYCSSIVVKHVNFISRFYLSDYTISKYKAEKVIDYYMSNTNLKITSISPGYIYGPYDKNFMPVAIKLLKSNIKFLVRGGEKNVPVVHVDDLCELFYLAGSNEVAIGKKYISLRESEMGIHDFLRIIAHKVGCPFPEKVYPKAPLVAIALILKKIYNVFKIKSEPWVTMRKIGVLSNTTKHFNYDAIRDLGWDHKIPISEGIDGALEWYKSNS